MFKNGCSIKEIARAKEKTIVEIEELVIELNLIRLIKPRSSEILGSKTEPYYESEEEMLNPPVYKYEDLTTKEKKFYESRNDK
jgi:hypothetical protein